jgi:lipopolysaccharide transport system ATP-binding protein
MSNAVVHAEHLGKKYLISRRSPQSRGGRTAREAMAEMARRMGSVLKPSFGNSHGASRQELWALKDVSLEIQEGERLGIIGRNGAGKSTLLKLLSRITVPTTGSVRIKGRVGSLLEVGTGFHPELTGRENIFLNGAILGMGRKEILQKFDEIVAFSEVERFLDTPVKRYSSGMYVRLAFAVAAHLEPDILIVDEVLAVGDAQFQRKCLGKMGELTGQRRTLLFVSHNMVAVQSLCSRVIWLDAGQIARDGHPAQVISEYHHSYGSLQNVQVWDDPEKAPGNDRVRLRRIFVHPENGPRENPITMQTPIEIGVEFWNLVPDARLHIMLHVYNEQQIVAFSTGSALDPMWSERTLPRGLFSSKCHIPGNFLNSGIHRIRLLVVQNLDTLIYTHDDIISFDVIDLSARQGTWYGKEPGVVSPRLNWTTEYLDGKVR